MRIVFTSCFSAALFRKQPVWNEIAAARPDVLVLLGDSMYLDCSGGLTPGGQQPLNMTGLQSLTDELFARHGHGLYRRQLQQADFQALIARPGLRTYAIWDDHDFLWNDACGGDIADGQWQSFVYPSRALFAAWQAALDGTPFPSSPPDWSDATAAPGYRHVDLGNDVHLHLTDGRSWRQSGGRALLGREQLQAIEAQMGGAGAGATHLLASATVVEQRNGEAWMKCEAEYKWLLRVAQKHNILVLSGDIHDNNLAAYEAGRRLLFEATSSGAALRTGVMIGSLQRNWGVLDIDERNVHLQIFKSNPSVPQYRASIDRSHWT